LTNILALPADFLALLAAFLLTNLANNSARPKAIKYGALKLTHLSEATQILRAVSAGLESEFIRQNA